jgi:hypothetical protein
LTFPWWCIFEAYGLSLLLAIVSIFFLIARGIEFGDLKTQKWLTSSILLIQPTKVNHFYENIFVDFIVFNLFLLKILALAILFACFIRKLDNDKEAAEYLDNDANICLYDDEEYLQSIKVCLKTIDFEY